MKLSIVMPVHNEEQRVAESVKQALAVDYPCDVELVVVDDGSRDATVAILRSFHDERLRIIEHARPLGRGAAVRTGAAEARGDYLIVLDADLQYEPADIPRLLQPVLDGRARVVFGSRSFSGSTAISFWYVVGNKLVTTFANVLFNCYISDLQTCYKLLPAALYRDLRVRSKGSGREAEITGKLLRRGIRPCEVRISYYTRSRAEREKITWVGGIRALLILVRERVRRRPAVAVA